MILLRKVLLFVVVAFPSLSLTETKEDFRTQFTLEVPSSVEQVFKIQQITKQIFDDPVGMAKRFATEFLSLPDRGWKSKWKLQLKVLDLISYLFAIEWAQYYASGGRWTPPKHLFQDVYLNFYLKELNPEGHSYASPVLQKEQELFAGVFFEKVSEASKSKVSSLLKLLNSNGRQFWSEATIGLVIPSMAYDSKVVLDIIPFLRDSDFSAIVSSIMRRSDGEAVLRDIMVERVKNGTLDDRHLEFRAYGEPTGGSCGEVLAGLVGAKGS